MDSVTGAPPALAFAPPRPLQRARPPALVAAILGGAALLAGPLAALVVDVNPAALAIVGGFVTVALLAAAGLRGVDLALLALNLGALAFFTSIHHRTAGEVNPPHPYYDWTFLRMTAPELLTLAAFFAFGGTMASFAALATRNFTTFLAAILIAAPVAGFRPIRALRSTRTRSTDAGYNEQAVLLDLGDSRLGE